MIRFSLRKFRCFYETPPIPIGCLTVLIGENSTGKTSFLAALRTAFDSISHGIPPSFNKDPFHLGAFDQIVNMRRGSREGRAVEFSINLFADIRDPIKIEGIAKKETVLAPGELSVQFAFRKSGSQPVLNSSQFAYHDYSIKLGLQENSPTILFKHRSEEFELGRTELEDLSVSAAYLQDFPYLFHFMEDILEHRVRAKRRKTPAFAFNAARVFREAASKGLGRFSRNAVRAIAPIRSKPRRTYDPKEDTRDSEGEYVPYRLARLKHENKNEYKKLKASLDKFGAASGLFDSIEIKQLGKMDSDPFQVTFRIKGTSSNLVDVGYGVSQAVPLVTDIVISGGPAIFLIQQPEVHLHPRAQAEFASFIKEFAVSTKSTIVLETHSDYILDRLRSHVRTDKDFGQNDLSIIYFEREGQIVNLSQVKIDKNGDIASAPPSYREFFLKEELRTLGIGDVPNN